MPNMEGLTGPEGMLKKVFDHIADGVLVADIEEQKFCSCNPAMCEMLGYSCHEVEMLGVSDIHPAEALPSILDYFFKQSRKELLQAKDIPVKKKDGSIFYVDINSIPMEFKGKHYLVGIFHDITGRMNIEKKLRENESRLRLIIDAVPDLMFRLDSDGRFVDYKAETVSQLFVPPEQFLGKYYYDVLPVAISQRMSAAIEYALETGKVQTFEYHLAPPGSKDLFYEARLVAVKGKYCVSICRNITEQNEAAERLKKSAAELRAKSKTLEQKNITLKEVLAHVENEKMEVKKQVSANVSKFILPILAKLKSSVSIADKKQIVILENGLKDLTSRFGTKIGQKAPSLSAREMEVCNMIRSGLATKEIAQVMKVSLRTVDTYRNRIRKKMGISTRDVNLFAYLQKMA